MVAATIVDFFVDLF